MSGLQQVHVRVNDAATGKPTPCRVRFTDAEGTYYAPHGRLAEFATEMAVDVGGNILLDKEAFAYTDGTCEIALPPGLVRVSISKGFEYEAVQTDVALHPGKLALRFELRRWVDMGAERWFSGDTRAHFLTPHAALLEGAAEDVAVINLLARECLISGAQGRQHLAIPNLLAFSGQQPAVEWPGHMVVVNTMNVHPQLGRLLLLNCHRVVFPLTFGGPGGFDHWTLADWCDQCHRKAGLVIGDGFFGGRCDFPHGELLADLLLGKVDALQVDVLDNPKVDAELGQMSVLKPWFELLESGFRIPLVGGSGKDCNLVCLGSTRTYGRLGVGDALTYKNWIEAVRQGRTFVTTGPLLTLTVNGQDPGAVVRLPPGTASVHVRSEARSRTALDRLEVVGSNGVIAGVSGRSPPYSAVIDQDITMPGSGWIAARCWGLWDNAKDSWTAAQTSPVYVDVEDQSVHIKPETASKLFAYVDSMLEWVRKSAVCENDAQRERLASVFLEARWKLQQDVQGDR